MQDKIYQEVNDMLNEVLKTEKKYDLNTQLLGENCIMDSITILHFILLCNAKYNIDVLENDINLDCLNSVYDFVEHICVLLNRK